MKKFLLIVFLALATGLQAQTQFGVKAGVNFANVNIEASGISISPSSQTSFHITGFADIKLNDKFSFQPGLSFQGKGYKLDMSESEAGQSVSIEATANYAYLEVPLNAVLYLPLGNGNLFLGAGPYAAFGIFGKEKGSFGFSGPDGEFDGESDEENVKFGNSVDDDVSALDFGLNFMAGYKLNSGLLFNAGYGLGLANMIPKDLRSGDAKANNRVFSVSVGFAF
jgi:hypothetical protein